MRAIDVETPPSEPAAAKTAAAESTPLTTKSAATAETSALLTGIVEALLHFVSAHRVEGIGSVARDRYGFCSAVRRDARNRHAGWNHVAHRAAGGILSRSALKHGKVLKAASIRIRAGVRAPLVILMGSVMGSLACPRQQNQFKIRYYVRMGWV